MLREEEAQLLEFCVRQRAAWDSGAWLRRAENRDLLSVVAFLLASLRWYGHRLELLGVAKELNPEFVSGAADLVSQLRFDCSRFVSMLEAKLRHESARS
jgi:hypothetical protein